MRFRCCIQIPFLDSCCDHQAGLLCSCGHYLSIKASMACILIVDDNEENLYMLAALLRGHGYDVRTERNGADALAQAARERPDLIISDILMPRMDGFTLCRQWKADPQLRNIPFIFYTATYTDAKDEEFALGLG